MNFKPLFLGLIWVLSISSHGRAQNSSTPDLYLTFDLNVDSAIAILDYNYDNPFFITNNDSIKVSTGYHILELSTFYDKASEMEVFITDSNKVINHTFLKIDEITAESLDENFAAKYNSGVDILFFTDTNSEIFLDNVSLGYEKASIILNNSLHTLRIENPYFGSKELELTNKPYLQVVEAYKKPTRRIAQTISVIPGMSQIYKKQYFKGSSLLLANLISLNVYLNAANEYSTEKNNFNDLVELYKTTNNEQNAFELGNQIELLQDEVKHLDSKKNLLLGTTLCLYALNIVDAFRSKPKGGFRKSTFNVEFEIDNEARIRFNF